MADVTSPRLAFDRDNLGHLLSSSAHRQDVTRLRVRPHQLVANDDILDCFDRPVEHEHRGAFAQTLSRACSKIVNSTRTTIADVNAFLLIVARCDDLRFR